MEYRQTNLRAYIDLLRTTQKALQTAADHYEKGTSEFLLYDTYHMRIRQPFSFMFMTDGVYAIDCVSGLCRLFNLANREETKFNTGDGCHTKYKMTILNMINARMLSLMDVPSEQTQKIIDAFADSVTSLGGDIHNSFWFSDIYFKRMDLTVTPRIKFLEFAINLLTSFVKDSKN